MAASMKNVFRTILREKSRYSPNAFLNSNSAAMGRCMCTGSSYIINNAWELDSRVDADLKEDVYKHRKHPGRMGVGLVSIPPQLHESIDRIIEPHNTKELKKKSSELVSYLWSRHRPIESDEIAAFSKQIESEIIERDGMSLKTMSEQEREVYLSKLSQKVKIRLKRRVSLWRSVRYDAYKACLYLMGRCAGDYAALIRIFNEIKTRVPDFKPRNMFDFGSGVGTSMWAVNATWEKPLDEMYCVDTSAEMSTIARLLLQGGVEDADMCFPGVYFRQFMPQTSQSFYDLVISAYSLMELPDQHSRLSALLNLWSKTKEFLVIVENGTNAGHTTVLEARDFLLQLAGNPHVQSADDVVLDGHVFAPCPHEEGCPRFTGIKRIPCNFDVGYVPYHGEKGTHQKSLFSYVILRKGTREEANYKTQWPRLVAPSAKPSKLVYCRMCTAAGRLEEAMLKKKSQGKPSSLYKVAYRSEWGDLLPAHPRQPADVSADPVSDQDEMTDTSR